MRHEGGEEPFAGQSGQMLKDLESRPNAFPLAPWYMVVFQTCDLDTLSILVRLGRRILVESTFID